MSESTSPPVIESSRKWYKAIGPGLITACVVIGPGSILTSSNVGARQGYSMAWVVLTSVIFMLVFMTMGARLGVATGQSAASIITRRAGRWLAVLVGGSVFFISAAFQFGNNLGVHFALESFVSWDFMIVLFNGLAIAFLLIFKDMYKVLEKMMMAFVGIMLVSFALNLAISKPRFGEMLSGFLPTSGNISLAVLGLIGTTFVTSAAFYQSYLVRQKGWKEKDLKTGMIDVGVGVAIMTLITLMLMFTPATRFHPEFKNQLVVTTVGTTDFVSGQTLAIRAELVPGSPGFEKMKADLEAMILPNTDSSAEVKKRWHVISEAELNAANKLAKEPAETETRGFSSLTEVGKSLDKLFAGFGPALFFLGLFAAAYSSFLVNSMIGGFMLADGLGIGDAPEHKWPRVFTILVLLVGMGVGLYSIIYMEGAKPMGLIITAQAVTVIASPLVAGSLLWLTSSKEVMGKHVNGPVLKTMGGIGFLLLVVMSINVLVNAVLPKIFG